MIIKYLKPGTKLMWDAPSDLSATGRVVYPVIVEERRLLDQLVKIKTGSSSHWMGPEEKYLRWPTKEELATQEWPSI